MDMVILMVKATQTDDVMADTMPAIGPDTWYLTEEGRHTVLGEVRRMGSQVMEIFDCLMEGREPPPANTLPFEGN
jgi:ketopantoate reductase